MKQRLDYIDLAKGLGIMSIVLGHIGTWLWSFHLPIFFIITGFLISHTKENNRPFNQIISQKINTLIKPYLLFSICFLGIDFIKFKFISEFTFTELLNNIYLTISFFGIAQLWFLPCLFFAEILFITLVKKQGIKSGIIICLLAFTSIIISLAIQNDIFQSTTIYILIHYFLISVLRIVYACFFIYIGYFAKEKFSRFFVNPLRKKYYIPVFIMLLLCILAKEFIHINDFRIALFGGNGAEAIFYLATSILGTLSLILFCKILGQLKITPLKKLLAFYGKNSLLVLCTHLYLPFIPITKLVLNILTSEKLKPLVFNLAVFIIIMVLEVFIIIGINKFIPAMAGRSMKKISVHF